jgi:hypothetical protein
LTCSTVDLDQYAIRRTVFISTLSTCATTATIAEPLLMQFRPLRRATVVAHRDCSSRGFCFSGTVLGWVAETMRPHGRRSANTAGFESRRPSFQAPSSLGAGIDAAAGLHRPLHRKTGRDYLSRQPTRPWQGDRNKVRASKGDRQRTAPRQLPLFGTWPVLLRSSVQVETVNTMSPCRRLD